MSHELRTPMNAIRGYAELLGRPGVERGLQQTWVRNLRRSTEYLLGLVHDVLDLSKIEAGHMRLELASTSLGEVLSDVQELVSGAAREKGLDLAVELGEGVPERFECDPVRLEQILVNLTGNGIKFTERGSVTLRVSGTREPVRRLRIEVIDTGIGIPAGALDQLFLPFSQVRPGAGGTGLGLQISRSLARLLGGDITVQSQAGSGSTFTLELPVDRAEGALRGLPERRPASSTTEHEPPAALRGSRILVVDDSQENREVLRYLLLDSGASCECAPDGGAGLAQVMAAERARVPFDAILMDMDMPVLDGFETTRRLVRAGVRVPIIALTALALAGDEERCRAAGCADYVTKPIVPQELFATLARRVKGGEAGAGHRAHGREPGLAGGTGAPDEAVLSIAQHPRFRGLVERYIASFPELIARLRELEHEGRLEELRTLVHRLRGTAATYGFPGLSGAAGRCEDAIRAGAGRAEVLRLLEDLLGRLSLAAAG